MVLGRGAAHQHSQHARRYSHTHTHTHLHTVPAEIMMLSGVLNTFDISSPRCLTACLLCKYVCLPLRVTIVLPCLYLNFADPLPSVVTADSHPALPLPLSLSLSLSLSLCLTHFLLLSLSDLPLSALCFSCHCPLPPPPGPGFVESAFLYPLDLAGLEHMQSAFSLYRRYGVASQCEYYSSRC